MTRRGNAANDEQFGPFERAARKYLTAGWKRPIYLGNPGSAMKWPPPDDYTGGKGVDNVIDAELVREWIEDGHGDCNVGLHMPHGVIGIDVDAYDNKHGDETIASLEDAIGELPPTVRSTARGFDNPSGIRFYRVPTDARGRAPKLFGKVPKTDERGFNVGGESGVEIIQPTHRYAVVWPSVHPDTGERYEWYTPEGRKLGRAPKFAALPELPAMWLERLRKGGNSATDGSGDYEQAELSREDVLDWLDEHAGPHPKQGRALTGVPCRAVRGVLRAEKAKLADAAETGSSRYDAAVEGVWALVKLAVEGHLGVRKAVFEFGSEYRALVRDEPNRDSSEWGRMVTGAVEKAEPLTLTAQHEPGDCPERDPKNWPSPNAPLDVARRYVAEHHTSSGGLVTLRFWRGEFYRFNGRHYEPVNEDSLAAELGALLHDVEYTGAAATPQVLRWNPTPSKIKAVMGMLPAVPGVLRSEKLDSEDSNPDTISLRNGLLDVATRELRPLTSEFFALHCLPFDYDPDAECPEWLDFLDSVWPDADDAVELLQEWFGYVVSGRTGLHKMMMLLGPTRSGKGTITRLLEELIGRSTGRVGEGGATAITFDAFGQNFGLQAAVGKTLITLPDARFDGRAQAAVVERLLSISGGDTITIDRKNRDPWVGRLPSRIMVVSNLLPELRESSGALMARFVGPLRMRTSFLGREDYRLEERLMRELPGVFAWALEGLDALIDNGGRFTMPRSSESARRQWVNLNSPAEAFLYECCSLDPNSAETTEDVYDAYHQWALDEGARPAQKSRFMRDLMAARPEELSVVQRRLTKNSDERERYVRGVSLRATRKTVK